MLIAAIVVLSATVIGLLSFIWHLNTTMTSEIQSARSSYLSASSAHDHGYLKVIDTMNAESRSRESGLRSEIQSLTEALGRSKEYVQVVYPRDVNVPLEPSAGWYDSKPQLITITRGKSS